MRFLRRPVPTRRGSADPRVSSGSASLLGAAIVGALAFFRFHDVVEAVLLAAAVGAVLFAVIYPALISERLPSDSDSSDVARRAPTQPAHVHAIRLVIAFAGLPIGGALADATGSAWVFAAVVALAIIVASRVRHVER